MTSPFLDLLLQTNLFRQSHPLIFRELPSVRDVPAPTAVRYSDAVRAVRAVRASRVSRAAPAPSATRAVRAVRAAIAVQAVPAVPAVLAVLAVRAVRAVCTVLRVHNIITGNAVPGRRSHLFENVD